jgi:plasmid stability protein
MHSNYDGSVPVNITIRAVPDEVRDELAARARRSGRSLQEYLTATLTRVAATPSAEDALEAIRQHAGSYPSVSTDDILHARDADRR